MEKSETETEKVKDKDSDDEEENDGFEQVLGYSYFSNMWNRMNKEDGSIALPTFLSERPVFSRFLKDHSATSNEDVNRVFSFLTFIDAFTTGQCICQVLDEDKIINEFFVLDL